MTSITAAALLHNTATRVTLGNTPLHAVPVTVAQQLKPLLESSTSLTAFTVHMQFTPPESLRLLLLGASRCCSLQYVRLVGGVSVLQSKMMMSAFTHFTFVRKSSRAATAARPARSPAKRCPHTPRAKRPPAVAPAARGATEKPGDDCLATGCNRPQSPEAVIAKGARSPPPCFSWLNGVHMVLDLHHVDDVVAGILLRGLERSERIVGLDLHIAPSSKAATRIAGRMLSRANTIVARNARRVNYLLCQNIPRRAAPCRGAGKSEKVQPPPSPPLPADAAPADYDYAASGETMTALREPSASDMCDLPSRRYSPPRLLSGAPPTPPSPPPRRPVLSVRHRLFNADADMRWATKHDEDDAHSNDCFVCGGCATLGKTPRTPERPRALNVQEESMDKIPEQRRCGSSVQPTPRDVLETKQPSPSLSHVTPCTPSQRPPSPRGQFVQHCRYLRGCVRDINTVVVRYQVVCRESVQRMVAEMRLLEEQLTDKVTTKLTDMMMSLSELERIEG
ncbi:hypothetical protein DQ04_00941060 [Trypanosoma grayi]|uniref:hypothetical protein n=1 Tax=Trypanosoma grayi TaxID=71804 RepID=UPI0004F4AD7E|nr:hypothetical protein DQ04_00941060 [Trypanosoma grayi]KEG13542.1 hypothetical protein DQ04_00941060 [Trypanosoma grayi]